MESGVVSALPERDEVIAAIEDAALGFLRLVVDGKLPVCTTTGLKDSVHLAHMLSPASLWEPSTVRRFLNRSKSLAALWSVLKSSHSLLHGKKSATLREAYYMDAALFSKQEDTNRAVQQVCGMLHIPRHSLGFMASARGIVAGDVVLRVRNLDGDGDVSLTCSHGVVTIPPICAAEIPVIEVGKGVQRVIVVEKECVMHRLVEDRWPETSGSVLVSGKGMPDLPSRALIHALHTIHHLPVKGLCDCGPFGVAILAVFRYGSNTPGDGHRFQTPLHWLGLQPSDASILPLPPHTHQPLTKSDVSKTQSLLHDSRLHPSWKMQVKRYWDRQDAWKCELEALLACGLHGLEDFLNTKLDIKSVFEGKE